ncbi:MAG: metal-dependent transcriptional regulator [Planctomycetota bacterium]|jgi:DtxR family Mn-dependent transcriptional regulator
MRLSTEAEEVLQALFSMEEEDESPASAEALLARARAGGHALREAVDAGFVAEDDAGFRLAPPGRPEAALLARRHRLAERLLHDVLRVTDETIESTACECEHFLEAEVVESICTLLGHPSVCPHGKPIPPGDCCNGRRRGVGPVVERLSEFSAGDSGRVAYAHTTSPGRLDRLASFGLLPGTAIQVHQTWPSVVVALDGTELAFDKETSMDIFVRRSGAGARAV